MNHKPYTLKRDYRHYVKGQVVWLRDRVAAALADQGVVGKQPDKRKTK